MWVLIQMTFQKIIEFFKNYITGFKISNNGNFKIDIAAGKAIDSTGKRLITSTLTLTCDLEASGENGLDTGVKTNNTYYNVFVIQTQEGTTAALLSLSDTPLLPVGYVFYRRVGIIYNLVANIQKFTQTGIGNKREYILQGYISVVSNGTASESTFIDLSTYFAKYNSIKLQFLCNTSMYDCVIQRQSGTESFRVYRKSMVHEYFYESPYYYGDGGSPSLYVKVIGFTEEL